MKKWLLFLLSMLLVVSLSACSSRPASSSSGDSVSDPSVNASEASEETPVTIEVPSGSEVTEESAEASSSPESTEGSAESTETSSGSEATEGTIEPTEEAGGTLVAYFSWSGNTEQMAQMIQVDTGGDLFEIEPATPYTEDYDTLLDVARQEQSDNARPELAAQVDHWDSYDVVFVGYPDWWGDAPMIIYSFLESYDWSGKTLVPFCTSGGSGFGRSLDKLPDSAPGAAILEGLHVSSGSVSGASEEVATWIDSLNLS